MRVAQVIAGGMLAAALFLGACSAPDDAVRIVGSSTVFPFSRTVAEHYSVKFQTRAPIVEVTGTGGGFQIFCGPNSPVHIANASRSIRQSELDRCAANGVADVIEFKIGYDGIVIAAGRENPLSELTLTQIYLALAKDLPGEGGFVPNPHETWADVDPSLPDIEIEVHGPPPTSGTRDAFVELALEVGAESIPELAALAEDDSDAFAARAGAMREDGRWIDEGENDNAIIQLIRTSSQAVGVFGYSFYDQNRALIDGIEVDGNQPGLETIADGRYPLARSMYFYTDHERATADVINYILEFTSESASGPYGYLASKGLIALPDEDRHAMRARARSLAMARSNSPLSAAGGQ